MSPKAWVPNAIDGVSIWKDVRLLNAPPYFDGRLLVPRPSKKEPGKMRWDVAGLVPLAEATLRFPEDVAAAVRDFRARALRTQEGLDDPSSPIHRISKAFSLPRMDDARDARNYFYEPKTKQLRVTNWGATRPPAWYGNEREDEGPASAVGGVGATMDLGGMDATQQEPHGAPQTPTQTPTMTKEEEAELEKLAAQIDADLAETRSLFDVLDELVVNGGVVPPK